MNQLVQMKILNGYADGTFLPDKSITRAEFTRIIVGALQLPLQNDSIINFKDSDKIADWARPYIAAALKAGVITGYTDNTFGADRYVSRTEIAVMVAKATHRPVVQKPQLSFADSTRIPEWAKAYVKTAVDTGIIKGKPGNNFMPNDNATRAEAATLIVKLLDVLGM
ncbi:MAG: S-layer homology domain-containing protein [Syntrophomonas sp.]